MVILGAGAAAIGWGISDYVGGDVSRRDAPVFIIVAVSEVFGVLLLLPVLLAQGSALPGSPRLLAAALAGCSTTLELGLIYRALSRGRALITAPVAALGAAVAVVIGVFGGDRLSPMILVGLTCALAGSAICSWEPSQGQGVASPRRSDAAISVGAALSVGVTLVLLHTAGHLNPYWVTAVQHVSTAGSAALMAVAGAVRAATHANPGEGLLSRRRVVGLVLIAIAGTGGDLSYVSASHRGALSIVAALASLYPVTTIALGSVLRGHRVTRVQLLGVTLALAGAVLLGAAAR
jgi:drug/metabolite transporter (DMT)-like permease